MVRASARAPRLPRLTAFSGPLSGRRAGHPSFAAAAQKEQARMLRAFDFSSAGTMDLLSGVHKMKSATEPPADLNGYAKYLNPGAANDNSMMFMATPTDFPAGSYIINMGITPQTVANGLKPYGLIYALIKTHKVPVYWAIKSGKVAYDEIDFSLNPGTPNVVRDYKSGAFIIPGNFITASVLTTINTWKATGVVVDGPTPAITGIPVYDNITYFPNSVLNNENTGISTGFYGDAGIPASAYSLKLPAALNSCDDLFIMPHADPTWATHQNLIAWNNIGGYIWAGCHAVSVFEDIDEPIEAGLFPNMNFLTTLGLAHYQGDYPEGTNGGYADHADGSYPATGYTYDPSFVSEPIMQILYNNGNVAADEKAWMERRKTAPSRSTCRWCSTPRVSDR
ncbi:MAG: hypothetical protein IPG76_17985 [Acidobacteria bacterium]|nr:hypothetical protein [Acidobacteriota bacterium]